ncbi:hypothetical protein [Providencia sp. PROV019]|uniref:hypothetical protein n=1 Tax=Providencia sp. PROV019 TaxID=2949754 RepID=UPI00234AB632|nr:hypothetical protein [Providencia sp. PROV019]
MNPLVVFLVSMLLGIFYYIKMKKWCIKSNIKGFVKYVFLIGTSFIVFILSFFILALLFQKSNNIGEEKYSCSIGLYNLSSNKFENFNLNQVRKGKYIDGGTAILTIKNNRFSFYLDLINKSFDSPELKDKLVDVNGRESKNGFTVINKDNVTGFNYFTLYQDKNKPEIHISQALKNGSGLIQVQTFFTTECKKIN